MSARTPRGESRGAWNPARDLQGLRDRMNRLLETVLRQGDFSGTAPGGWSPVVDFREDAEGFLVAAEIPGVRRENLTVRLEGAVLTLEGRRPRDRETQGADYQRMERMHGSFSRTFNLPAPVNASRVRATYLHGVLEVFLPRSREARADSVRITVG